MIIRSTYIAIICILMAFQFSGCGLLEVQGPEPAFLNIPSIEILHESDQGPVSHEIKYVEIFFEQFSIGFYKIPVEIAIIPTKDISNLTIKPAIQLNGTLNAITPYPMMKWHTVNQEFKINETYTFIPTFEYVDNIVFDYVETFELANSLNFNLDEIDSSFSIRSNKDSKNGNYSALFSSENARSISDAPSTIFTELNNQGRDVFLEFDYKNTVNLEVGLIAYIGGNPIELFTYSLPPRSDWNKFYLELGPAIELNPSSGYRIFFSTTTTGSALSEVFIDNIKLSHIP